MSRKEFRVDVKIKNNRLIAAREERGLSAPQLCAAAGIVYSNYIRIESLQDSPISKRTGDFFRG